MKTIVLANQKGGVGKSAMATMLSHYLVERGQRVLAIDLDHQGNLTKPLKLSGRAKLSETTADRLLSSALVRVPEQRFVVVPSDCALIGLERQADQHNAFASRLRDFLRSMDAQFDACVIDTNPNPDIRLIAALVSADFVLSPIQLNQEAIDGIAALLHHDRFGLRRIRAALNPKLKLIGIVPTMVEPTPFQRLNFTQIVQHHAWLLLPLDAAGAQFACVPRRSAIAEAQSQGAVLWEMKKTAARDAWREIEPTFARVAAVMAGEAAAVEA
jgi:chromosome partitioning protein